MQAIFLDIETTGLDPRLHGILEIAFKVVDLPSGCEKSAYQATVKQPAEIWNRRDFDSIAINGFTWEKLQSGKNVEVVCGEIIDRFTSLHVSRRNAVYICQNPAFDRNFFSQIVDIYTQESRQWPYHWLDLASMYWALQVKSLREAGAPFPEYMNLSKNTIAEHYHLPKESLPHSAMNGVDHLLLCYRHAVGFTPFFVEEEGWATSCDFPTRDDNSSTLGEASGQRTPK